jgi:hypothetical protein
MTAHHRPLLGELLLRDKLISLNQLEEALSHQPGTSLHLGEILLEMHALGADQLKHILDLQHELAHPHTDDSKIIDFCKGLEHGIGVFVKARGGVQSNALTGRSLYTCRIPKGTHLRDLLGLLGIPELEARGLFVNSHRSRLDYRLMDGDRVEIST